MAPQLAPDCTVPTLGGQPIRITTHALDRFQERMNRGASRFAAFVAMRELLAYGMVRSSPRWWTTGRVEAGTRYVYSDLDPDVCLVVVDDAVATVLTRQLCLPPTPKPKRRPQPSRRRPQGYSRQRKVDKLFDSDDAMADDLAEVA